ncbi:MAG: SUF system NifU family Fe-S cluster assembly protein [Saprospiraceae bacterium]
MNNEDLNRLYDETILEENRTPYHYEKKPEADLILEAYNPLCGDQFKLFLFTDGQTITSAYFHGYGCAVSKASTSILTRQLEGLSFEEAQGKCRDFLQWLAQKTAPSFAVPKKWESFAAVRQFPGRLTCAQLAWGTICEELH